MLHHLPHRPRGIRSFGSFRQHPHGRRQIGNWRRLEFRFECLRLRNRLDELCRGLHRLSTTYRGPSQDVRMDMGRFDFPIALHGNARPCGRHGHDVRSRDGCSHQQLRRKIRDQPHWWITGRSFISTPWTLRSILSRYPSPQYHRQQLPEHLQCEFKPAGPGTVDPGRPEVYLDLHWHFVICRYLDPGVQPF